jgi:hypothetical protein
MSFFIAVTMSNPPKKTSGRQSLPNIKQDWEKSKKVFILQGGLNSWDSLIPRQRLRLERKRDRDRGRQRETETEI